MRSIQVGLSAALAIAAGWLPAAADYVVKEIGSFHIGGRTETLTGLPTREIVFTAGAPPAKVDPNGEFEVEQMYVQYIKLAQPRAKVPILLWHGGGLTGVNEAGRQARMAAIFSECRLRHLRVRCGRARPSVMGALSGNL